MHWLTRIHASFLGIILLSGCATTLPRIPFNAADLATAQVFPGEPVRFWADNDPDVYREWGETLAQQRSTSQNNNMSLLALSGGSDKGAYSAGLLNGWTQRGSRPQFDIVTGVSTGALIAPFAFLGADEDDELRAIYTGIDDSDIYRHRVLGGLLGGTSLLDSKPLAKLIARYVTPDFLERIAVQHRLGRRLLVLTTNLDAQRGVVWDMGAIAANATPGHLALFREVLLASASIPGAFPPVMINASGNGHRFEEMHVDGGAIGGFFVMPRAMLEASSGRAPSGSSIHILYNGQISPQFEVVSPRTFSIMGRALSTVLGEIDRTGVDGLRGYAENHNIALSLCAIDSGFTAKEAKLFDRDFMRALYAYGLGVGRADNCLLPGSAQSASTKGTRSPH